MSKVDPLNVPDVIDIPPELNLARPIAEPRREFARPGAVHLNGGVLVAVDVETTGLDPAKHELIQICILPLDSQIRPLRHPKIGPFYMELAPQNTDVIDWEACGVHKVEMARVIKEGLHPDKVADLLEVWFEKFKKEGLLGEGKKFHPLAQNYVFDRSFLQAWLGPKQYEYFFDGRYRDTMVAALYANDKCDYHGEAYPYPKVGLQYLGNILKIESRKAHDALSDCLTTAEVYRRMVMNYT